MAKRKMKRAAPKQAAKAKQSPSRKNGFLHAKQSDKIDIGIEAEARQKISDALTRVLADTYVLYFKTHGFHWNVQGPMFQTLHMMFETQYVELREAVDTIAERVRALGYFAPGSTSAIVQSASIKEEARIPPAKQMIKLLAAGHESLVRTCRMAFEAADAGNDQGSADMLTARMEVSEKTAWMLRSLLD